ncbi:MAG: UDP-N-acetylmuramoyl-tripeptide-D-alanyl-D-alanine ligase, partial [Candidatus Nomurabacteria bacterium GW2011_GWB1_37_5]
MGLKAFLSEDEIINITFVIQIFMIKYPKIKELNEIFRKNPFISTDTRNIKKDSIFFALKGDKFDGNSFAKQALDKGAKYAVVSDPKCAPDTRYILVKDTLKTLQDLAYIHRRNLKIPIVAICGSNGKTTTKELIRSVLSQKYNVFSTHGNLNNHIGVPLSLLQINKKHQIAVVEIGANHIGETKKLCEIAEPVIGLITNNGEDHLAGFGGIKGVIKANNELYQFLRKNRGLVFVNQDDRLLSKLSKGINRFTYGQDKKADVSLVPSKLIPNIEILVGKNRIKFVESRISEIKEAITKQDIKDLLNDGAIIISDKKGIEISTNT